MPNLFLMLWLWSTDIALADEITFPKVEFQSPAAYPEAALQEEKSGSVLFEIALDESGQILAVEIVQSSDPIFEEPALEAIQLYQFTPAFNEAGEAVAVTIQYRLNFEPEKQPTVVLRGTVRESGIREPIDQVKVLATNAQGQQVLVRTDKEGNFAFLDLAEGPWSLEFNQPGLITEYASTEIVEGKIAEVKVSLVRDQAQSIKANAEIIVEAKRETSEVSVQSVDAEEISILPGSNGDVVKAIQNLPGIARAPSGIGQLIIRGTAPEDSAFYINGIPIPDVFHFAGLTTVVSTANISEVQFLPGNYSVRYGRQLGGMVNIQTPLEFPEREDNFISVDLYQSAFFVEKNVSETLNLAISARRSYADVLVGPILSDLGLNVRIPRYYDFQTQAIWKTPSNGLVQGLFYLSDDQFSFAMAKSDVDEGEEATVNASYGKSFEQFQMRYEQPLSNDWVSTLTVGGGNQRGDFVFDATGEAYEIQRSINLRQELLRDLQEEVDSALRFGVDINSGEFDFLYDLPSFPYEKESAQLWYVYPAVYGEYRRRGEYADMIVGLRGDWYALEGVDTQSTLLPRIASRFFLTDNLNLLASSGWTSQAPLARERSEINDGKRDLQPEISWQNSFGLQQEFPLGVGNFSWQAVGYFNELNDLVVGREDRFQFFTGPPPVGPFDTEDYANLGTGFVCGSEYFLRYSDPLRLAQISASFSHSERTNRDGESRLFLYDQPIVFNAIYTQLLSKNWRLGTRVRYGSGNPYTPVVNRVYSMDSREFIPVYGERDSGRLPPFFAMDIRIDKEYVFRNWKLDTYLDIQNATAYPNLEVMSWSFDYDEETPITGLPTTPIFGFKGEW